MNTLKELTIRNLRLNKKRTIGTIIGIIMSVALICAVSTMATSFRKTLVQNAINETGYYHIEFFGLKTEDLDTLKNNRDIKEIKKVYNMGSFKLDNKESYINIYSLNKETFKDLSYKIEKGRIPDNQNEIMISKSLASDGIYKIGDTIKFDIGYFSEETDQLENAKEKQYKIVGITSRSGNSYDYLITIGEESDNIKGYVSLKKPYEYKTFLAELLEVKDYDKLQQKEQVQYKYDFNENRELLRWEAFGFSDNTIITLFTVCAVVIAIILVTSIFCIRNSFAISYLEKIKMYGMLSSIGATKKQIKKNVVFEGVVLGLIAIPLGIITGIVAIIILIKIVNSILGGNLFNDIDGIQIGISIIPIMISILLGILTIYFSSISTAKKAGKVSPIEQLNNLQDIKIKDKKLKVPYLISKLFKTGGKLAYKNLKRSKKKYRTTVISLTVSICIFITMFSFLTKTFIISNNYYKNYDYNISVIIGNYDLKEEQINKIKQSKHNKKVIVLYESDRDYLKVIDNNKINDDSDSGSNKGNINIVALDNEAFKEYVTKIGLKYDEVRKTGILCDFNIDDLKETRIYKYNANEEINGIYKEQTISIKLGGVSKIKPTNIENWFYAGGYLVVNKEYYSNIDLVPLNITIDSNNTKETVKEIKEIDSSLVIRDLVEEVQNEKNMILIISIFLYGFIAVITLIGITNIFNTITSNMELRQKEIAMLKSIGMTKREFNHMINLETIFYSTKSLIYGITLGVIGSYFINQAYGIKWKNTFLIPYQPIVISIIFVFLLVYIIMKYSITKINKQNTIETIRKDTV